MMSRQKRSQKNVSTVEIKQYCQNVCPPIFFFYRFGAIEQITVQLHFGKSSNEQKTLGQFMYFYIWTLSLQHRQSSMCSISAQYHKQPKCSNCSVKRGVFIPPTTSYSAEFPPSFRVWLQYPTTEKVELINNHDR